MKIKSIDAITGLEVNKVNVCLDGRWYSATRTSLDRLSGVINDMMYDGRARIRAFQSGLGWHADIENGARDEIQF